MHNYTGFAVAVVRRQKVLLGCRSLFDRSCPVIRSFDERDGGTSLVRNRIAWTRCKKETSNQSCISTRLSMYRCVQLKQKRVTRTWITRLECRYRYRDRCKSKRIDAIRSDEQKKKKKIELFSFNVPQNVVILILIPSLGCAETPVSFSSTRIKKPFSLFRSFHARTRACACVFVCRQRGKFRKRKFSNQSRIGSDDFDRSRGIGRIYFKTYSLKESFVGKDRLLETRRFRSSPDDSGHGTSMEVNVISLKDLPFSEPETRQDSMEVKVEEG